mmetsp:Transcript_12568/g.31495  ORF Transcript_12568/g.31495 Transcript_12568/m.31495 type:complete len:84 (+) Transcript_12568:207-458(+)
MLKFKLVCDNSCCCCCLVSYGKTHALDNTTHTTCEQNHQKQNTKNHETNSPFEQECRKNKWEKKNHNTYSNRRELRLDKFRVC